VTVETRATVAAITDQLSNLRPLLQEVKQDIPEFNNRVDALVDALHNRDAPVPELLHALFKGYLACEDKTFTAYISRKRADYLDGTINLTSTRLMALGLENYKVIGKDWLKKTDEELEFIAMRAEIKHLKQNPTTRSPKAATAPKAGGGKPTTATGRGADRNTGKFAWKGVAPKAGEPHEKKVDGKDYIYCPHH
jgi:hypothetical protein